MNIRFVSQPDEQFGIILRSLLEADPRPVKVTIISAFVSLQTAIRFRDPISELHRQNARIQVIIGIDLGGTSIEALREILSWRIEAFVIKHRVARHTFHPKIFLIEWPHHAEIFIGSNNFTEGGFFANYESSARISYDLPADMNLYENAQNELRRFLNPGGPTAYPLTEEFLAVLVARGEVPNEADARRRRGDDITGGSRINRISQGHTPFGADAFEPPPPLPANLLGGLLEEARLQRRRSPRQTHPPHDNTLVHPRPLGENRLDAIAPAAFYMTLPTLQGPSIPGEARIPLEAIELAQEFWGWPREYTRDEGPRGGGGRVYWNWRPIWLIWSVDNPTNIIRQAVRMYMYENSSDFRFYVRALVRAGGDLGDIVRITRIAQPDVEYECILARRGTPAYNSWISYCTQPVRNSPRRFGYA